MVKAQLRHPRERLRPRSRGASSRRGRRAVVEPTRRLASRRTCGRSSASAASARERGDERHARGGASSRRWPTSGPLVLVFEDLHWADDGLLDFVDHLVDWATGVPLLVVCTARPELLERRPGWGGGKRNALTLSLAPLSDAGDGAPGRAPARPQRARPRTRRRRCSTRAGGNPLYTEQFVAHAGRARRRASSRCPRTCRASSPRGSTASRRARRPCCRTRRCSARCSGRRGRRGGGAGDGDVELRLHALERKEFVRRERRSSVAGETEYAFAHVLVRDVAYAQIPRAARADEAPRARPSGSSRWAARTTTPRCSPTTTSRRWSTRAPPATRAELEPRTRDALRAAGTRVRARLTARGRAVLLAPPR